MTYIKDVLTFLKLYPLSFFKAEQMKPGLQKIRTYCMFIGYPRSGHTLIGSLLDAHPEIIVAQELGVLKYLLAGFNKWQIYYLLIRNSRRFTDDGRAWASYAYNVQGQWQGKYRDLRVVGDKQGGGAVLRLKTRPWLFERLMQTMGEDIRFFHVIRNPYDNITTISRKNRLTLEQGIDYYFSLCETVQRCREKIPGDKIFEIRHETFVQSPRENLKEMCSFLNVGVSQDYLNDCAGIVFPSPKKTRLSGKWDRERIGAVKSRMRQFPYLDGYSFE
jgi:hypothetical protein